MQSRWIEHQGKKIPYQDSSNLFYNTQAVKVELASVQYRVLNVPENSILVLSDFTNTEVGGDLMPLLNASSNATKSHIRKTAVVGVAGMKRLFGDLLSRITGQPLLFFADDLQAKEWLTRN